MICLLWMQVVYCKCSYGLYARPFRKIIFAARDIHSSRIGNGCCVQFVGILWIFQTGIFVWKSAKSISLRLVLKLHLRIWVIFCGIQLSDSAVGSIFEQNSFLSSPVLSSRLKMHRCWISRCPRSEWIRSAFATKYCKSLFGWMCCDESGSRHQSTHFVLDWCL